jgi:hypothetical protein
VSLRWVGANEVGNLPAVIGGGLCVRGDGGNADEERAIRSPRFLNESKGALGNKIG